MLLGVHCSIKGGLHNAFHEAESLGIDTFQVFTKNQRQWKEKIIDTEEKSTFLNTYKTSHVKMIFSHASYLINLASNDDTLWERSIKALIGEVQRCHDLGLDFTIVHPGSSKELGEQKGMKKIIKALKTTLHATENSTVKILLENTAGQGTCIGYRFEHLKQIIDGVNSSRIGVCFDTCHAFAAGYDIRTKSGFEATMEELDNTIGLRHLQAIHLNDSKGELGSKRDRHEHIGKGKLGLEPFRQIMNRFTHIPKIIETPKE
ncbi:MAG: deoxyribonuclease IV, partial [Candidatus Brocadiaceae bacterium]|uniref:deoxyribonuclease IV n=1 Tax=Candidatus Wunengus sp. YC61 TaxID=3367698 RepID=UPI00272697F9|nr:deoxyribonuclease IV [Candidatus Brocadiaceae bacterium]